MRRFFYYIFKIITLASLIFRTRKISMFFMQKAHSFGGVTFKGKVRYIHPSSVIDASGEVVIGDDIVISTGVLILSHDYSITTGFKSVGKTVKNDIAEISKVIIGDNCFIGANSTILPGSIIGDNVIVGAGSLVKGKIDSFSLVVGNPAKKIMDVRDWVKKKDKKINKYMTSNY